MYTGIPKDSTPAEKTRPKYSEYYEWTGFTNLRLDKNGCLQPGKLHSWSFDRKYTLWMYDTYFRTTVGKNEAGKFITNNNCPPAPYPVSTIDAPDVPNPYYLVEKSRGNTNAGQSQSFLQPGFIYADEPSPGAFAPIGITDNRVASDAAYFGSDAEFFDPLVADHLASTPVVDDTFHGWDAAPINLVQKLKRRRGIKSRGALKELLGD